MLKGDVLAFLKSGSTGGDVVSAAPASVHVDKAASSTDSKSSPAKQSVAEPAPAAPVFAGKKEDVTVPVKGTTAVR